MSLFFDLSNSGSFTLGRDLKYFIAHKGAKVQRSKKRPGEVLVSYKSSTSSTPSPGFRIPLRTVPNQQYRINFSGKLRGNQAFIYVEARKPNTRLLPREKIYEGSKFNQSVTFRAVSTVTYIGILFYSQKKDCLLTLNSFQVLKDSSSGSRAISDCRKNRRDHSSGTDSSDESDSDSDSESDSSYSSSSVSESST